MNIISTNHLERLKKTGFTIDIGNNISQGFNLFKKNAGLLIGAFFVMMIGAMIPIINFVVFYNYIDICRKLDKGEDVSVGHIFNTSKLVPHLILSFLLILPFIIIYIPFMGIIFGFTDSKSDGGSVVLPLVMIIFMVVIFVILILYIFTVFAGVLVHYTDMGAVEAIKNSFHLVKNNFLQVLITYLVISSISSIGIMLCYIGIIVSAPIAYSIMYYCIKQIFFTQEDIDTDINLIGS